MNEKNISKYKLYDNIEHDKEDCDNDDDDDDDDDDNDDDNKNENNYEKNNDIILRKNEKSQYKAIQQKKKKKNQKAVSGGTLYFMPETMSDPIESSIYKFLSMDKTILLYDYINALYGTFMIYLKPKQDLIKCIPNVFMELCRFNNIHISKVTLFETKYIDMPEPFWPIYDIVTNSVNLAFDNITVNEFLCTTINDTNKDFLLNEVPSNLQRDISVVWEDGKPDFSKLESLFSNILPLSIELSSNYDPKYWINKKILNMKTDLSRIATMVDHAFQHFYYDYMKTHILRETRTAKNINLQIRHSDTSVDMHDRWLELGGVTLHSMLTIKEVGSYISKDLHFNSQYTNPQMYNETTALSFLCSTSKTIFNNENNYNVPRTLNDAFGIRSNNF